MEGGLAGQHGETPNLFTCNEGTGVGGAEAPQPAFATVCYSWEENPQPDSAGNGAVGSDVLTE